jgi:hypothetical protein
MSRPADTAARSSMRAKPAVVNGDPRSETNMNGDAGASRWRRRNALISRPVKGCVLGVPFFALRTCKTQIIRHREDRPGSGPAGGAAPKAPCRLPLPAYHCE